MITPCYPKCFTDYKEGKTLWRVIQNKVQRFSSQGMAQLPLQCKLPLLRGLSQESKFTPETPAVSNGNSILFQLHSLSQHTLFSGRMWTKWIFGNWQFSSWSSELPLLSYFIADKTQLIWARRTLRLISKFSIFEDNINEHLLHTYGSKTTIIFKKMKRED